MYKPIKAILSRQESKEIGMRDFTTDDTQNLGYCASGIRAISHALWFYAEYTSDESLEFTSTVKDCCHIMEVLAAPLEDLLFSAQAIKEPEKGGTE
ncbi:hypothetical protein AGMMS49942_19760 [Spirochaetia bacterium]|nr:hypothetical protein AGMMS49942_19760 [Spirochaetia bacterium]